MKIVFAAGVLILVAFVVVLQFIPLGIEPLTEVYFENHTKLPVHIFPMQKYNFSFTVRNLEYQRMGYDYEIFVDGYLTNEVRFELGDNESGTFFESFVLGRDFERARIEVFVKKDYSLENPEFRDKLWWPDPNAVDVIDVHFWVDRK